MKNALLTVLLMTSVAACSTPKEPLSDDEVARRVMAFHYIDSCKKAGQLTEQEDKYASAAYNIYVQDEPRERLERTLTNILKNPPAIKYEDCARIRREANQYREDYQREMDRISQQEAAQSSRRSSGGGFRYEPRNVICSSYVTTSCVAY